MSSFIITISKTEVNILLIPLVRIPRRKSDGRKYVCALLFKGEDYITAALLKVNKGIIS